uniref:CSON005174 protein n=1 Tax=Culicoides sonorensis TaxID=179676 RepID=A0A336KA27_CULSO
MDMTSKECIVKMPPLEKFTSNQSAISRSSIEIEIQYENREKKWLFDDALTLIGFGRVQLALVFICGLLLISMMTETMGMMMLMTPAMCDLNLTTSDKGLLTMSGYVGILIPSYMWGYLSDRVGRRQIMIYTLFSTSIAAVGSSLAPNFIWFMIFRFFAGFFVCASTGSVYPYLGEFNTLKNRQVIMAWCSIAQGLSMIFVPVVGWAILSLDFHWPLYSDMNFRPWRLIPIIYTLPGFIAALMLYSFPESPKFYMAQGREDKALQVLEWIWCKNTKMDVALFPVKALVSEMSNKINRKNEKDKDKKNIILAIWSQTVPLFKKPHVKYFLIACYMQLSVFTSSGGMGLWFTELQNRVSSSDKVGESICYILQSKVENRTNDIGENLTKDICDDTVTTKAFLDAIMLGAFYVLGFLGVSIFMKLIGRGWIMTFCLFASALSGIFLQWVTQPFLQVFLFSSFIVLSGITVSLISATAVMLFPTNLRAMAVCIILMVARIGASAGSAIIGVTIETYCHGTFGFITFMLIPVVDDY